MYCIFAGFTVYSLQQVFHHRIYICICFSNRRISFHPSHFFHRFFCFLIRNFCSDVKWNAVFLYRFLAKRLNAVVIVIPISAQKLLNCFFNSLSIRMLIFDFPIFTTPSVTLLKHIKRQSTDIRTFCLKSFFCTESSAICCNKAFLEISSFVNVLSNLILTY